MSVIRGCLWPARRGLAFMLVVLCGDGCAASEDARGAGPVAVALSSPACGGMSEAEAVGVVPPAPPAPTTPPPGACTAATTAALYTAVHDVGCLDVLLASGTYEATGPVTTYLSFVHRKRLWAAEPGSVVLRFGVNIGQHAGSELHGLVIDIDDPVHGVPIPPYSDRNAVLFWGAARDVEIADTTIRGHGVIHRGINASQPNGLRIQRVVVEGVRRFGVLVPWAQLTSRTAWLTDLVVRRVGDPAWRALPVCAGGAPPDVSQCYAPGTQEHGIWLGFPTHLERARVRDAFWSGLLTASHPNVVSDVFLRDIDVDVIGDGGALGGIAIGFEKITHDLDLERFCVGPAIRRGVHAEWDNLDGLASSAQRLHVHHGVIAASWMGLYFDYGTRDSSIHDLHIRDASWAGVGLYRNYLACAGGMTPEQCNTTQWSDVTFDVPPGACELTLSHPNLPQACLTP